MKMPIVVKQGHGKPDKQTDIRSRIRPIAERDLGGIKINIYGQSGTGKTRFWSSFPKPILALICSGGQETRSIVDVPDIEEMELLTPLDINDVCELQNAEKTYKTIVLDHASAFQDLILTKLLGIDTLPAQMTWGVATREQWGQVSIQFKEYVRNLLKLHCNVVIVAQERVFNGSDEGSDTGIIKPTVASALSPSIKDWLNPNVDYVCQTFIRQKIEENTIKIGTKEKKTKSVVEGVEYCLRTAPSPVFASKFRAVLGTEIPDCIVNPTYAKLMSLISGK
jgi:hypothetical protein